MEKIKVLQVGGNTQKNGITTYLLDTYEQIHDEFTFVFLNTSFRLPNPEIEKRILSLGGKIYNLSYKNDFKDIENSFREILKSESFDVIHAHYFSSNGHFLKVAYEERIPIRISHCHNNKSEYLEENEIENIIESRKLIEDYATKKLAVTHEAGKFLYGNNSFEINRMVLNLSRFYEINNKDQLKSKYGLEKNYRYSIFVGRFSFQKNIYFLLEIAKKLLNRKIIMVGEGPLKLDFQDKIKQENIEDKFLFMSDINLNEVYNLADSLLLPSFYEGLSITLFEAQKAGLICLASSNLSQESNKGNVIFLDFDANSWSDNLNSLDSYHKKEITNINDLKESVFEIKKIYTGDFSLSDIYVNMGRKFALGSELGYQDWTKSKYFYEKAIKLGNLRGVFYLALMYFEGSGVEKDVTNAHNLIKPIILRVEEKAKSNEAMFLTILGDMYSFGFGKERNFEVAARIYNQAANLGSLEAMCDLGYMYQVGQGVELDAKLALKYYKESAEKGYLHSMRDLALCYIEGIGTKVDYDNAIKWLKKASLQNYSHATTDLAWIYYNVDDYKNLEKSVELYLLGIKQDRNRAYRDLIANSIDIKTLINEHRIEFFSKNSLEEIEDIDENILVDNTIVINKNIQHIEPNIFYNHPNIKKFFVEKDNPNYASFLGVLYSKDLTKLIRFPMGSTERIFKIPIHVRIIGNSAFDDCKTLEEVIIGENIEIIEDWAFHGCDSIKTFYLPKTIKTIGEYAFGSCESLREIIVDEKCTNYHSFEGCLFNRDFSILHQYPIGSKLKAYRIPSSVKNIGFRAFSDAFNLEYIDASHIDIIEEKAFYYCSNLKKLIVNKKCNFNGEKITDFCHKNLKIEIIENGRVLLLADIHGHLRLSFFKNVIDKYKISKKDIVIILGDAGIVWSNPMNKEVEEFYSNLNFDVLFLDGNHENFDELESYEIMEKYGAKTRKVFKNVFQMLRGEVYLISSLKYFVFGGAYSIKRDLNDMIVPAWKQELPNKNEMDYGLRTIEMNNYNFDYILTHQGPRSFLDKINYTYSKKETVFLDYLENLRLNVKFNHWYFGHIHQDIEIDNIKSIYSEVVVIDGI